jgi:hypothetical protein
MHVFRVLRVLLPIAIVLAIVAGVAAVLSARPDLQRAERDVDHAWTPVAQGLAPHYRLLSTADDKLVTIPGPSRDIANEVRAALARWNSVSSSGSVTTQVRAANTLEALGRRLVAAARVSKRAQADAATRNAVEEYAADPVYASGNVAAAVTAFNKAVMEYEQQRTGPVRGVVATLMGDREIPAFTRIPTPI